MKVDIHRPHRLEIHERYIGQRLWDDMSIDHLRLGSAATRRETNETRHAYDGEGHLERRN